MHRNLAPGSAPGAFFVALCAQTSPRCRGRVRGCYSTGYSMIGHHPIFTCGAGLVRPIHHGCYGKPPRTEISGFFNRRSHRHPPPCLYLYSPCFTAHDSDLGTLTEHRHKHGGMRRSGRVAGASNRLVPVLGRPGTRELLRPGRTADQNRVSPSPMDRPGIAGSHHAGALN